MFYLINITCILFLFLRQGLTMSPGYPPVPRALARVGMLSPLPCATMLGSQYFPVLYITW